MCKTIQNYLKNLSNCRYEIKSKFFTWQIREITSYISCGAQLSVILRYVDAVGIVQERFIGFFNVSLGRDAASLFNFVDLEMAGYDLQAET